MRKIPQPLCDEPAVYDRVSGAHSSLPARIRLKAVRLDVTKAYAAYLAASEIVRLRPINGIARSDSAHLRENYRTLRQGKCKDIGFEILRRSTVCCLCWDRQASQIDHYLPKDRFPEFSVLTANLVPVCGTCNQKKASTYRRLDGGAAFLHAYYDSLPEDEQFLIASVHVHPETVFVRFGLQQTANISSDVYDKLVNQFGRLGLGSLYGELATAVLNEKLLAVTEYFKDGGALGVQKYLGLEARSALRSLGFNHWRPVLLQALAADTLFCDGGFKALGEPDDLM